MEYKLQFVNTRLKLGTGKAFKFLHVSDFHVALADERDCRGKLELSIIKTTG